MSSLSKLTHPPGSPKTPHPASKHGQEDSLNHLTVPPAPRKMKLCDLNLHSSLPAAPCPRSKLSKVKSDPDHSVLQAAPTTPTTRRGRKAKPSKISLKSSPPTHNSGINTLSSGQLPVPNSNSQFSTPSNPSDSKIYTPTSAEFSPSQYPEYGANTPDLSKSDFSTHTPIKSGNPDVPSTPNNPNTQSHDSFQWSPTQNNKRESSTDLSNFDFSLPANQTQSTYDGDSPGLPHLTPPTTRYTPAQMGFPNSGSESVWRRVPPGSAATKIFPQPDRKPLTYPEGLIYLPQTQLIPQNGYVSFPDIANFQGNNPSHQIQNFDPSIFEPNFTTHPSHPVETPLDFQKFKLEHMIWLDAMMIRRKAEGRRGGLFGTDQQDFEKRFGWMPLFEDFMLFALEYSKDPLFYHNWYPGKSIYKETSVFTH